MKPKNLRQELRKSLSVAYRTKPVRLRNGQLWTPPGKLYDLTAAGLLVILMVSSLML